MQLPEQLLARFRAVSFERLERIEARWTALTRGGQESSVEDELFREMHTLKGDARVIGFGDIAVLCQRLEDLLGAARLRRFQVHDDVDIVVSMGIQFVGMLLRQKAGSPRAGIDLDGFLRQIDEVMNERLSSFSSLPPAAGPQRPIHMRLLDTQDRVSPHARDRLAIVATSVFLEHLRVGSGASKSRLRDIWITLVRELALLDSAPLLPVLERHAAAATDLARELGKMVNVVRETRGVLVVGLEVLDALNTTLLHTLRNAIDHGVGPPEERVSRGKPAVATIHVRASLSREGVDVVIEDDGRGVDLEVVRRRAVAQKLLGPEDATVDDAKLLELLFHPGFSTRESVSDVSGRGVGLDAVRAAVARTGGTVELQSTLGVGTSVRIHVPQINKTASVLAFRGPRTQTLFALPEPWSAAVVPEGSVDGCIDLMDLLALPKGGSRDRVRAVEARRDRRVVMFAAGSDPVPASAARICPTPVQEQIEIVDLGRGEAVLVRPETLHASAWSAGASE